MVGLVVLLATLQAEHLSDLCSLVGYSPQFVVSAIVVLFSSSSHEFPVRTFLVAGGHCLVHLCTGCTGTPLVHVGPVCSGLPHLMPHLEGTSVSLQLAALIPILIFLHLFKSSEQFRSFLRFWQVVQNFRELITLQHISQP